MYTRHQRFLKPHDPYKRLKKAFNKSQEHENAPIPLTGHQVFLRVQHFNTIFGKTQKMEKKIKLAYGRKGRFCLPLSQIDVILGMD